MIKGEATTLGVYSPKADRGREKVGRTEKRYRNHGTERTRKPYRAGGARRGEGSGLGGKRIETEEKGGGVANRQTRELTYHNSNQGSLLVSGRGGAQKRLGTER